MGLNFFKESGIFPYQGNKMPCNPMEVSIPIFHLKKQSKLDTKAETQVMGQILIHSQRLGKWVGITLSRLEREVWKENVRAKKEQMGTFWTFFRGRIIAWSDMEPVVITIANLLHKDLLTQSKQGNEAVYYPTPKLIELLSHRGRKIVPG